MPKLLGLLLILSLVALSGCSGGSAGGIPNSPPQPPSPVDIFEVEPLFGGGGDVITFRATSIDSNPANLKVEFSDSFQSAILEGLILSVTDGGTQQGLGTIWEVEVMVPGGVRSGFTTLYSNGFAFGGAGFTAAPEILGVVVGQQGDLGAVSTSPAGSPSPGTFELYGYNLAPTVNQVAVEFSGGNFDATSVFFNPPPGAGYTLPPGTTMVRAGLPNNLFSASCDTEAMTVRARAPITIGSQILESGRVDVSLARLGSPADPPGAAETPAYFTGAVVPAGIRRGDVAVDYTLFMAPASSTYDIVVEYQDPADSTGQTWLTCTAAASSPPGRKLPGSRVQEPGNGLIGVGAAHRFVWDTLADLPSTGPIVTRLRLRAINEAPAAPCSPGEWQTPRVVVDNSAPPMGELVEDFDSASILDNSFNGNVVSVPGFLQSPANGGLQVPSWGSGTVDLVLAAGTAYTIDTTGRTILDTTDPLNPFEVLPASLNPGFVFGEFHLRSLIVEVGAAVSVVGTDPLVIRCSGSGLGTFAACTIGADLILDGEAGTTAGATTSGVGGAAGPGGGSGGDGGFIEVFGGEVTLLDPATAGEFGGAAGESTSLAGAPGTNTLPHGGPGGGGGGSFRGGDGIDPANPSLTLVAPAGLGGAPRGDARLTVPVGGGGGGGGGACALRLSSSTSLVAKHGGGGGGGGGALEIVARGTVTIDAALSANGGDGGDGNGGSQPGAGGGGAGGTIALRATGGIVFGDQATLSFLGGLGGSAVGTNPLRGGDGADGTLRLETPNDFSEVVLPTNPAPGFDAAVVTAAHDLFETAGYLLSRGRTLPYRLTTSDGVTVGAPILLGPATIDGAPGTIPGTTFVAALFEGAAAHPTDRANAGEYFGYVSDPSQLEGAEFIRVWWYLYGTPANLAGVDRLAIPYDN